MAYLKVFISHAHDEKALAEAWKDLLNTASSGGIEIWFSSDTGSEGGINIGQVWRDHLYKNLSDSDFVIAIQTPTSAGRPWIMWECAAASNIKKERGIIPIVYSMGRSELANPLTTYQVYLGDSVDQVRQICDKLITAAELKLQPKLFEIAFESYLEHIKLHQPRKAIPIEQMILWRDRFEQLIQSGRIGEVMAKRQAMYLSLIKPFKPIDPKVHEILSKILLDNKNFIEAIEEIDYALTLVGEDIDLLHRKALALIEIQNLSEAESLINQILQIDKALRLNPEIASLEGRLNRERWLITNNEIYLDQAIEAYLRSFKADRTQHYPGINAGSLLLAKGDIALAESIFHEVFEMCLRLQQQSITSFWTDFSAGEALLGLGDVQLALAQYRGALSRTPAPQLRERESAMKGVKRMVKIKDLPDTVIKDIEQLLT